MNRHEPEAFPAPPSPTISGLLHQLTRQLSTLLRQELTLARTELFQSVTRLLSSVGTVLGGGVLLFAGLMLLLFAAVFGLALLMPLWLAALSLGATLILLGGVLVRLGRQQLKQAHLTPSHLPRSLRKDKEVLLRRSGS